MGENILGRMLDSFWLTLASLAGPYHSFKLTLRYDVAVSQVRGNGGCLKGWQ